METRWADDLLAAVPAFVLLFGLTFAAAAAGSAASIGSAQFYQTLVKPSWAPSPAVFGPVWTLLYTLMAVAAFLVVREVGWRGALIPLIAFAAQLCLNALWTWLFFRWRLGSAAFADVIALLALVAVTAWLFWSARPLAGALLLPYLGWVAFASALTWSLWHLNPGQL